MRNQPSFRLNDPVQPAGLDGERRSCHSPVFPSRHSRPGLSLLGACLLVVPGVFCARGATVTLAPVSDAYVNDSDPNGSHDDAWLVVGRSPAEFTPRYRSFLRFDLGPIPGNAVVSAAALRLNLQAVEGTVPATIEVHRVLAPWNSPTWNNQPAITSPVGATVVGTVVGQDYQWAIPGLVQSWVSGQYANYGLELQVAGEMSATTTRTFAGQNHSNAGLHPELVVTYSLAPDITVNPTGLMFGNQRIGTLSAIQVVTVRNDGASDLVVNGVTSTSGQFVISGTPPFPASLAPGASGSFQVRFAPSVTGLVNATVQIDSNDPDEAAVPITCTGTGVVPDIDLDPATLTFGNVVPGAQSPAQTLTIRNLGTADLHVSSVSSSSGDFMPSLGTGFPVTIAPGATLALGVRFAPTSAGLKDGVITIFSDDPDEAGSGVACSGLAIPELSRSTSYEGLADGSVRFNFAPPLNPNVAMTLEAWVRREDPNRTETIIAHDRNASFWFGFVGAHLRFYRSGGQYADSMGSVAGQRWTHVAAAYDGSQVAFFIDGEPAGVNLLGNSGAAQVDTLQLAGDDEGANFRGLLDEVRLWDHARSEQQIHDALYEAASGLPGLLALFPSGGPLEAIHGVPGQPGPGAIGREISVIREPLRIPRALEAMIVDGQVDPDGEYRGALELVIRYEDGPDAVAYLVHEGEPGNGNLYVAFSGLHNVPEGRDPAESWVAVGLDPNGSGAEMASTFDLLFRASLAADPVQSRMLTGDGLGGFNDYDLPPTEHGHWDVDFDWPGEFPPPNIEFCISKSADWLWAEPNRLMIGHFDRSEAGDNFLAPGGVVWNSPATWPEAIYVENSIVPPRVSVAGYVWNWNHVFDQPVAGQVVELVDEANGVVWASATSGADGRYEFNDVSVRDDHQLLVRLVLCEDCRFIGSQTGIEEVQPVATQGQTVVFPAPVDATTRYAQTDFRLRLPLGPVELTGYSPHEGVPRLRLREEPEKVLPEELATKVRVSGANLHPDIQVYLYGCDFLDAANGPQPLLGCQPDINYFEARITDRAADESWVEVEVPHVPRPVHDSHWGSQWAWVVRDNWLRAGMQGQVWTRIGGLPGDHFALQLPLYPAVSGFEFDNEAFHATWDDFIGVFGANAYSLPCAARVDAWPDYEAWFGTVFLLNEVADGSCNGMAATSLQLHRLELDPENNALLFGDEDTAGVHFASGFQRYRRAEYVDEVCEPTLPKNLAAHIRVNHLVQFSAEYIQEMLDQMEGGIDQNPRRVLNLVLQHPGEYVISMVPEIGKGHVVTPYAVREGVDADGISDPNVSLIMVYDNNRPFDNDHPGDYTERFIEITLRDDRSSYRFARGGRDWSGQGIYAIPVTLFDREFNRTAPGLTHPDLIDAVFTLVTGGADVHGTDGAGGEWGWLPDGSFVDQLPDARSITPVGGPDSSTRNVMLVLPPGNPTPHLAINVHSDSYQFYTASGGRMLQLERGDGVAGDTDDVDLAFEAGRLTGMNYHPQRNAGNLSARLGFRSSGDESVVFELTNLLLPGGTTTAFKVLPADHGLEIRNASAQPMHPVVSAHFADGASGSHGKNYFSPPEVPAGAVQQLVIQDWPQVTRLRVETDLDQDGVPDLVNHIWADSLLPLAVEPDPIGHQMVISWPATATGFLLEAAPALDTPTLPWTLVDPPYATNGNRISVSVPTVDGDRFFRLRSE